MITNKVKLLSILIAFIFLLICFGIFSYSLYKNGKQKAELECKEKEVQVQTQTVEVIKYIYRDSAKELLKPNKTFKELLERMKKNEI